MSMCSRCTIIKPPDGDLVKVNGVIFCADCVRRASGSPRPHRYRTASQSAVTARSAARLLDVVRLGGFDAAAKANGTTALALRGALRRLEDAACAHVFRRDGCRIVAALTDEGRRCLESQAAVAIGNGAEKRRSNNSED